MVNIQIVILYVRIFPLKGLHKACWIIGVFSMIWGVVNLIVLFAQCIPIPHFWAPNTKGHCIDQNDFYAVATVIATVNILVIFCIPIPIVWKLKVSTSKKWSLAIAFTLGTMLVLFHLQSIKNPLTARCNRKCLHCGDHSSRPLFHGYPRRSELYV